MSFKGFQKKMVRSQETFSARLKHFRTQKGLTLAGVEDQIKIRERYVLMMEMGQFTRLPSAHAKGFIRRYGQFLGISSREIDGELIHLDNSVGHHSLFLPGRQSPPRLIVTPRTLVTITLLAIMVAIAGYTIFQVRQFAAPPSLEILSPSDRASVANDHLLIEGTTDPGATVLIDSLQANSNPDGSFRSELTLRPGLNQITIRSVNRVKKETIKTLTILLVSPQTQT